jgi:TonB family protein
MWFARTALTICLAATMWGCTTTGAKFVERRENVTYSAYDWSLGDLQGKVDVAPQVKGGMSALTSHLAYPPGLRRRHITGVVRVRVSLDATGRLLSAQIVQSANPALDAIVLRAVREVTWTPAIRAGKPVPCTFRFPITFAL